MKTRIQFSRAFANKPFFNYLEHHGIETRAIIAPQHKKNFLESKHRITRDVFLRLMFDGVEPSEFFLAQHSV